jgi:sRNA-binding regulator protein Hfq
MQFDNGPVRRNSHPTYAKPKVPGTLSLPPKGHDATLKKLQDNESLTNFYLIGGGALIGTVLDRDKFTITVLVDGREVVLYKHAILYFTKVH